MKRDFKSETFGVTHLDMCSKCRGPERNDTIRPVSVTVQICGHIFKSCQWGYARAMSEVMEQVDDFVAAGKICVKRMDLKEKP